MLFVVDNIGRQNKLHRYHRYQYQSLIHFLLLFVFIPFSKQNTLLCSLAVGWQVLMEDLLSSDEFIILVCCHFWFSDTKLFCVYSILQTFFLLQSKLVSYS